MDHLDVLEPKFLVDSLANESFRAGGSGSMSISIYDTAWVSMVSKNVDGVRHWLFPEAFQHIVDAQAKDGSWESYSSQVDGILNTMAVLLALLSHQSANNFSYSVLPPDIDARILKAQDSLRHQLQTWDVRSRVHVGFETLVPALLGMLEQHNVVCEFPEKLSRFQPEIFYKNIQVTALNSLEAFTGTVDFNRIKHHLKNGSIMAFPSSTAAYLMNTSTWDNESKIYLRNTIIEAAGKGNGSVPCAFLTTFFEFTWVVSTLLKAGYTPEELGEYNLDILMDHLPQELSHRHAVIGFAPSLFADADDTAKCILTLCLTYALERNESISGNYNVINALLHINEPSTYIEQILRTTEILCNSWSAGKIDDKWYSMKLLAQAFRNLVMVWDSGALPDFPGEQLKDRIPQWFLGTSGSCEVTAYGILTLIDATFFPWAGELDKQMLRAIRTGQSCLNQHRDSWDKVTYTWVGKNPLSNTFHIPFDRNAKFAKFFSAIPLFTSESSWKLTASIMEGYLFLPRLRRIRLNIFPRHNMAEDKYLEYIPFTWTGCNNKGIFLETDLIWDMMADEFMEAVLGHNGSAKHLIRSLFSKTTLRNDPLSSQESSSMDRGVITPVNSDDGLPDDSTNDDRDTLIRFKDHVLNHPSIQKASRSSLAHLSKQLKAFLLAYLIYSTDNSRFAQLSGHDADTPSHSQHQEPIGIGYAIFPPSTHHVPIHGTGYRVE
ncbi:putative ent-kaurene synthase protein [Botrytis fragariae]|uniref:Putative ent-kaurene synthase protein n=1 Tax=Botrytis fragariae TaxID=1964551 RepID=A0A8H6B1G7_9HELO|nr:putative ent-kaurene synthase protein [Botrytis fragariae]KAF5877459.1 putative ent-kaurene synthase protein [Botrytis fragariae]